MRTEILTELHTLSDEKYRQFHQKLVPARIKVLGVRIPLLHKIARDIITTEKAEKYLAQDLKDLVYQEEFLLYGLVLAKLKESAASKINRIKKFIPYINNWAVCDIFCSALKQVKIDPELYYKNFLSYRTHFKEYDIRFFYVLALNYFIMEDYIQKLFSCILTQKYCGYYDKMAVAWFISGAYIKYPQQTEEFLQKNTFDKFVFQKSISKICDSLQVKKEAKMRLRTLTSQNKHYL